MRLYIKSHKFIYIMNLFYSSFMIFYTLMPKTVVIMFSLLINIYNISFFLKDNSIFLSVFLNSILMLPTSFVSILASSYGEFPLTWFSLQILFLTLYIFLKGYASIEYMFVYLLFSIIYIMGLFKTKDIIASFSQFLSISLFFFSFQIGYALKKREESDKLLDAVILYIFSSLSVAFQLIMQIIFINKTNIIIGHYVTMGTSRVAYGGLMNDYSFVTLFLTSSALLLLIYYIETRVIPLPYFIFFETILLTTSVLVSSRTGLISFAITLLIYFTYNFRKINKKFFLVFLLSLFAIPFLIKKLASMRDANTFFDSSGRIGNFSRAVLIIKNNFMIGVGLGANNLVKYYQIGNPHNFFIQYLLQMGVLGVLTILINLCVFIKNNVYKNNLMWLFLLIMVGSMFIPDIFSSRFFNVIVILIMMNSKNLSYDN